MKTHRILSMPAARIVAALWCLLLAAFILQAQQTSGSISGTVRDTQGAVVPGAHVTLTDQVQSAQRKQDAGAEGTFAFTLLAPSTYTVAVEVAGFKKWEKTNIPLYANDRLGVNDILLEVGRITDTVTVEASATQLQTESASVAGTVSNQQMTELSIRDRNFMTMLRTIPGVANIDGYHINVNGSRPDQTSFRLDGMSNMDYGDNGCCATAPNMDMIAEMKIVTNSGTADMGSLSGAQVNVVTKGGSKEFHGNVYFFKRAEWMNANSWTNNQTGIVRSRDRSNQGGFTLGGPLFIPKLFNTQKEKLYFFVSEELWKNLSPNTTQITVPTALERTGNYTQSTRNDSTAVTVLDPTLNRSPFPGNIIPINRWNSDAAKLINLYPLPNVTGQPTYNFRTANTSGYSDRRMQNYRVDYNLSDRWRLYARYSTDYSEGGSPAGSGNYGNMASFEYDSSGKTMGWQASPKPDFSGLLNVTTIISSTFTNELVVGGQDVMYFFNIDKGTYTRTRVGLSYVPPNPQTVIGDYGPIIAMGGTGLSGAPYIGTQLPYIGLAHDYNLVDNMTKVFSRHTLKAGLTFELNRKDQNTWYGTTAAGLFNIGRDSSNPGDTDYQWANLLTGAFNTFSQVSKVIEGRYIFKQTEFYVADTWKVRPNLTLDYGMRFYLAPPGYDAKGQVATFNPSAWDPAKAVTLYGKALVNGKSVAINPMTGVTYPSYMQGAIIPGSGNPDNGFVVGGTGGYSLALQPSRGVNFAPRFGLAWQPAFLPKTVIRLGGGVFYDRMQGNPTYNAKNVPPISRGATLQYGNMGDVSAAQGTIISPPGISGGFNGLAKIPTTVNWNFTIERELPYATLLSIGYVGNIARHLVVDQPINEPGFGSAWLPQNQDKTVNGGVPKFDGTTTLPVNFYRPYVGIGQMDWYVDGESTNYNSLQFQATKRMSRKLSFGATYTWSKALGLGDAWSSAWNAWNARLYNYGRMGTDRTQIATANFVYYLPKFGRSGNLMDHKGLRLALNDWEVTGFVQAQTGTPSSFSYSINGVSSLALSYTGANRYGPRPVFVSNWKLPSGNMNEYAQFNTASFIPASRPSVGLDSGFNYWSNPTTFWSSPEVTMMKNVVFSKDSRRYVQFRVETYNLLNHHDYTGRAMSATFKSATDFTITNLPTAIATQLAGVPTTAGGRFGFGALNGAASPRRLQVSLKIYF